jgi:hypothetical protein
MVAGVLMARSARADSGPDLYCTSSTQAQTFGSYQDYCYKSDGWESLSGSSPTSWSVEANDTAGGGWPYPDVRTEGLPSSSSFRITMPSGTAYSAEAAYDVCQNDCASSGDEEMMVWAYNVNQSPWEPVSKMTKVTTWGGWTLYRYKPTLYLWKPTKTWSVSSATVDIAAMAKDTGMTGLNGTQFGWEIPSTEGRDLTFTLDSLSI